LLKRIALVFRKLPENQGIFPTAEGGEGEGMDKVSRRQKLCRRASDKSYENFETGCEEKMTAIK
jgi:hypothetical protein